MLEVESRSGASRTGKLWLLDLSAKATPQEYLAVVGVSKTTLTN